MPESVFALVPLLGALVGTFVSFYMIFPTSTFRKETILRIPPFFIPTWRRFGIVRRLPARQCRRSMRISRRRGSRRWRPPSRGSSKAAPSAGRATCRRGSQGERMGADGSGWEQKEERSVNKSRRGVNPRSGGARTAIPFVPWAMSKALILWTNSCTSW